MMHAATLVGAKVAMGLCGKAGRDKVVLLDFGCGTGRTMRFFGENGYLVVGTEITLEMLVQAQRYGLPEALEYMSLMECRFPYVIDPLI